MFILYDRKETSEIKHGYVQQGVLGIKKIKKN